MNVIIEVKLSEKDFGLLKDGAVIVARRGEIDRQPVEIHISRANDV